MRSVREVQEEVLGKFIGSSGGSYWKVQGDFMGEFVESSAEFSGSRGGVES